MSRMQEKRELPGALKTLAGVVIVFLLLATGYVIYQAGQVLFPPNTYETALLATVEDTVDAEGVLLFDESYVAGDGTLGYLVADGERVSAGTAVAEVYSDASQAALRQQLTQLGDQIDLLQKSQNTTSAQMETLRKDRSAALYNLMDSLDTADYEDTDAEKEEQAALRKQYVADIKASLRGHLNNISIVEKDGSVTDLGKKYGNVGKTES